VAQVLLEHGSTPGLVVRGPAPGGLDAAELGRVLGLPVLVAMPQEPHLPASLERGNGPGRPSGPLATAARTVLDELRSAAGSPS
jgi:hypothetical protein